MEYNDLNLDIVTHILSFVTILPKYIHLHSNIRNAYQYHLPEMIRFMRRRYFGWNSKKNEYLVKFNIQRMAYLDDWESITYLLKYHNHNYEYVFLAIRLMNLYNRHDLAMQLFQIKNRLFGTIEWYSCYANNIEPYKKEDYLRCERIATIYNKVITGTYQFISEIQLRQETEQYTHLCNRNTIRQIRYIYQKYNIKIRVDNIAMLVWTCKDLWSPQLADSKCINKNIAIKSAI